MKKNRNISSILFSAAMVATIGATSAFAASPTVGTADFLIQADSSGPSDFEISEHADGTITGNGSEGLPGNADIFTIARQAGGIKGIAFGRFLNIVCNATECTDQGPTNLELKVTTKGDVTHYDGTFDYQFVNISVSSTKLNVSINNSASFELTQQSNGSFYGDGNFENFTLDPSFMATLKTTGSLNNLLQDPATLIAFLVSPLTR